MKRTRQTECTGQPNYITHASEDCTRCRWYACRDFPAAECNTCGQRKKSKTGVCPCFLFATDWERCEYFEEVKK